jgi:phytoene dehydrogenase-like protein
MKVIVVGAGLTCAKGLRDRGAEVAVFEASDGVGVRPDEKDGFQVYSRAFEYTEGSSINASMLSGEKAAREVPG